MAAVERALETARSTKNSVLEVLGELAMDSAGQSRLNAPLDPRDIRGSRLLRASASRTAKAGSCVAANADGNVPDRTAARRNSERHRGKRSGTNDADEVMGLAMSWAINPESTLRKRSKDVWELICPSLKRWNPEQGQTVQWK